MATKDFNKFSYILAIDPGYGFHNGTGYAIFDDQSHRLKKCGLLKPFAPGLESHRSTIEMAQKVQSIWESQMGFHYDPKILCIEYPTACFSYGGVKVNSRSIIMLAILATRIEEKFKAQTVVRPSPQEWKVKKSKEETKNFVLENLCAWSKKNLQRDLSEIPQSLHHNVYDAIGLGLWSIKQSPK